MVVWHFCFHQHRYFISTTSRVHDTNNDDGANGHSSPATCFFFGNGWHTWWGLWAMASDPIWAFSGTWRHHVHHSVGNSRVDQCFFEWGEKNETTRFPVAQLFNSSALDFVSLQQKRKKSETDRCTVHTHQGRSKQKHRSIGLMQAHTKAVWCGFFFF